MNHQRHEPAEDQPAAHSRYLTLGGATVVMRHVEGHTYQWRCAGCRDASLTNTERITRQDANDHASECRSMPPEQPQ